MTGNILGESTESNIYIFIRTYKSHAASDRTRLTHARSLLKDRLWKAGDFIKTRVEFCKLLTFFNPDMLSGK